MCIGVLAVNLYGATDPEHFGTLGAALYTLFTVMTLEGWVDDVVNPLMEKRPGAWLFFIPFIHRHHRQCHAGGARQGARR
jgi:voltage-gated sodium channel